MRRAQSPRLHLPDVGPVEADGACGRSMIAVEAAQQARLAGAVGTDDGEQLAGRDRKTYRLEDGPGGARPPTDTVEFEKCRGRAYEAASSVDAIEHALSPRSGGGGRTIR
jgi:hypothetical protein